MKKDTITRMLEEVDQSMAFRAERLIAKVMPTLDIKKPVAQRRESVFIALTDGFALEEKKVEEPVLAEAQRKLGASHSLNTYTKLPTWVENQTH